MKVTLTRIATRPPQVAKSGKTFTQLNIQTREHGQAWISGFKNKNNEYWKVGDVVDIDVKPSNFNGKEYLNYSVIPTGNTIGHAPYNNYARAGSAAAPTQVTQQLRNTQYEKVMEKMSAEIKELERKYNELINPNSIDAALPNEGYRVSPQGVPTYGGVEVPQMDVDLPNDYYDNISSEPTLADGHPF